MGFEEGYDENRKKNPDAIAINSTLFLFLWFLYILFKPTAPTIQQNQVYGNPQKIELKEGKKKNFNSV